ncbi:hypothetical protein KAT92_06615 [Candidatus Babeliales bacterium]|nr:hypothetical protein [Candidatus Babeliales bacterium]
MKQLPVILLILIVLIFSIFKNAQAQFPDKEVLAASNFVSCLMSDKRAENEFNGAIHYIQSITGKYDIYHNLLTLFIAAKNDPDIISGMVHGPGLRKVVKKCNKGM